jgi:multidrug efflux system outer membrane protein
MGRYRWALAALLVSGCAVGPDYTSREPDVAAEWVDSGALAAPESVPGQWWRMLGDPELDELLRKAAASNLDIGIARTRIEQARAVRGIARSAFWPQAELDARYTNFEQSIESPGAGGTLIDAGLIPRDVDFYTASLDASWELDLFGGRRREAEAAAARLQSAIAEAEAVRLSVLSETATAYFEMRGAEERLAIARRNLASQARTLELTRRKVESGLARRIDELRAEAQWNAARARLPSLAAAMRAANYRLAVLTAERPEAPAGTAPDGPSLPPSPGAVPVGMRADVLRRRPDVQAAERALAAATAEVGVAKADFFPRLVLSASYGFEAEEAGDIGSGRARTTALVPFVRWPLFQGGRLRANLEGADARALAAALQYEKAILQALADAESAIAAYSEENSTLARLDAAADASAEAADIAQRLYEQGLTDFLTVLDAQRRRDEAADALAQSHTRVLLNLARLYKSLGGGWSV